MLLLPLLFTLAFSAPTKPCKVGFRLDDVQDYWFTDTQQKIIQTFVSKATPLTVGIISKSFGLDYDPNSPLVPFLNNLLAGGANLEIASTTMDPTSWTALPLADQIAACKYSRTKLTSQLPGNKRPIRTMFNPSNLFTQTTLDALRNTSFNTLSSTYGPNICTGDGHVFYSSCADTMTNISGIFHAPANAITSANGIGVQRYSNSEILSSLESACNSCGYAVLEIHFLEYSDNTTGKANATAITELGSLVDTVKTWANTSPKLLQDMVVSQSNVTMNTTTPTPKANTTVPKAPVPKAAPKAVPVAKATPVPKAAPKPNQTSVRTSGSSSTNSMVVIVFASLVLNVLFS